MTRDIKDFFVLWMQQNYLTFETVIFWKRITSRLMVHYSYTLVDIKHLINLKWLTLV
jgi:hypothetical protein